jgi:hypothetical protein
MSTIKQGEAVFQAVSNTFDLADGAVPETGKWSEAQKNEVYGAIFKMFKDGTTVHSKNPDDAALLKYIPGLVNNWVRKDGRLNGGTKYETKRPGTRSGSGDEMVKEMRKLLTTLRDPEQRDAVQAAIDARLAEIKPKVEINSAALPESLRHLVAAS